LDTRFLLTATIGEHSQILATAIQLHEFHSKAMIQSAD
jgi:hypothetical protein